MAPSDRARVSLDYDEVLEYIGQFGRFQKKIFFWLSFISAAAGLAVVVFAFTGNDLFITFNVLLVTNRHYPSLETVPSGSSVFRF